MFSYEMKHIVKIQLIFGNTLIQKQQNKMFYAE